MKQLKLIITEEMNGQVLEKVIKKYLGLSKKQISQAKFRSGGITINGNQVRTTYVCQLGEKLRVCVDEDREDTGKVVPGTGALDILYEDEDVIVLDKPGGIPCHPGRGHYEDSLGNRLAAYFVEKGEHTLVRPVGRLDRDTSGIMLYAKNQIAAARLCLQKQDGVFQKEYLALVEGCFHTKTGQIKMPIGKIPEEKMKMCVNEKGKSADTQYEVLETFLIEGKFYSLVGCRIATGRTHQIRVHMAWMGHPVVGDVLYGHDGEGQVNPFFTGLGLHAERVSFQQPYTGKKVVIENVPKHWFLEDIRKKGLTRQI